MPKVTQKEFEALFRRRLLHLREASRRTQAEVAEFIGVSEDAYGSYERRSTMPLYLIKRLARFYQVPLDWLLDEEDTPLRRLRVVEGGGGDRQ